MSDDEPATAQERWAEAEAKFCDQMVAEYRGPLLDGWKKRHDHADNAFMQARCLINAEVWEQIGNHLRQPRRMRIENENYAAIMNPPPANPGPSTSIEEMGGD